MHTWFLSESLWWFHRILKLNDADFFAEPDQLDVNDIIYFKELVEKMSKLLNLESK